MQLFLSVLVPLCSGAELERRVLCNGKLDVTIILGMLIMAIHFNQGTVHMAKKGQHVQWVGWIGGGGFCSPGSTFPVCCPLLWY